MTETESDFDMKYTSQKIFDFCKENSIECSEEQALNFDVLYEMLVAFNAHTNVTALKTEEDICSKHFIDSLYPLKYDLIPDGAKVIDIGCGAGFPGLPLKMLKNDIDISFVDSTEKKLRFTSSISEKFGLDAKVHPARAEELVAKGNREKYDVCVSRAVASLQILCELCLPYVKKDGIFIAYKSMKECDETNPESELFKAKKAVPMLGGKVEKLYSAPVEESDGTVSEHALLVIRKVKNTPEIYPRRYAAMLKKPL